MRKEREGLLASSMIIMTTGELDAASMSLQESVGLPHLGTGYKSVTVREPEIVRNLRLTRAAQGDQQQLQKAKRL